MKPAGTRTEHDAMGPVEVPEAAYWGASTQRALANFPISGKTFPRPFIAALGLIKAAAAQANHELGLLPPELALAIAKAAWEVADGRWDDQFPVDVFQTGSGTSTHMNANEVIANRAAELLGGRRGDRVVHPNDHVNLGQSSNDVIPTTVHLAALLTLRDRLLPALTRLETALNQKADAFWPVVKTGRTHLQDAIPVRLGQEFGGYAAQVGQARVRLDQARRELSAVALGGTAVGTGFGAHRRFAERALFHLSEAAGVAVHETGNHFAAQASLDGVVAASGAVRGAALALVKVAGDIALLGSGPRAGYGEITLPAVQPGSSMMPGKVNPVIAEALIQACAQVVGNDAAIAFAAQRGAFELNTMWPVAGCNLVGSMELLAAAAGVFCERCVVGITATGRGPALVASGLALATALVPAIGYDRAAAIAREAAETGRTIPEVARERTNLSDAELARLLDPASMTGPGDGTEDT
ncbi:MAG: class II fumarate hydratase [Nitrospirae bacterium]|nr:class II fumarate hydratase [Nitrospirota bacterium]